MKNQLLKCLNDSRRFYQVHMMNDKKNENVDELAGKIAQLAVALKKELKILTSGNLELFGWSHRIMNIVAENFISNFFAENVYTDTEDNDSPTVQCTFTLPSRRTKYTTPSSTESESSNTRKKYAERVPKMERQSKHHFHEADNSSGGDENYDGSDETTLYHLAKRCTAKNKGRRESSDNISTSNSESIFETEFKSNFVAEPVDPLLERQQPTGGNVVHCSLTLDTPYSKGKLRETVPRSRIISSDPNETEREDNDRQVNKFQ